VNSAVARRGRPISCDRAWGQESGALFARSALAPAILVCRIGPGRRHAGVCLQQPRPPRPSTKRAINHRAQANQIGAIIILAGVVGRLRRRSILADSADGAFRARIHPDDPASGAALTTKGNLDAQGAQEGLSAPQSAGQRPGILGPAGAVPPHSVPAVIGAGPQQVGGAARPGAVLGHQLAHAGGHRVGVDGVARKGVASTRIETITLRSFSLLLDMRLEARKPRGPHRFGLGEPAFQIRHSAVFQRVDANARVELGMGLLNELALLQLAQMPAHRRRRQAERVRELARPARPLAKQFHRVAAMGVGERREGLVDAGVQSSRFFVVRPLALSHSSGVMLFSVTPKVQIWPSGSRAR
jgi:hypothetical protein